MNWENKELKDILQIKGGKRMPKGSKFAPKDTGYFYIRVTDMDNMTVDTENIKSIPKEIHVKLKNYQVSNKDLYLSIAGTIGKVGEIPDELDGAILTENAVKLILAENINKRFLSYLLNSPNVKRQIAHLTKKMGQPKLAIFRAEEIKVPLPFKDNHPNIEEQKRIADKIDALFAKIDEAIAKTKEALGLAEKLLQSELKKVFDREPSEEWKEIIFGSLINIFDSKRIPINSKDRGKIKGQYPYLGANGVVDYINKYIFDGEYLLVAEDGGYFRRYEQTSYIFSGKFWVNNHAHIIQALIDKTSNKWLFYYFMYEDIGRHCSGATRLKLTQEKMRGIPIPLPFTKDGRPDLLKQEIIIKTFDLILEKARRIREEYNKQLFSLEKLKQSILNQAFEGKL